MKVVFVVGATASGKSSYAQSRALKNSSAIINCDSIQIYQGLKIGSALPTAEEMSEVPHYLYSYVPKGEKSTAGQYSRDFYELMQKLEAKYEEVLVVGGTGFYFQAIERGMFNVSAENPEIRKKLEARLMDPESALKLYQEFASRDPEAAKRIFPNDHYRLVRAMELMISENKTLTEIQNQFEASRKKFPWPLAKIGIQASKEELLAKVKLRTKKMLGSGLIEEVEGLRQEGFRNWAPMESVGYKEVNAYLDQRQDLQKLKELEELIVMNTMKLTKKQRTWFQRDPEIRWSPSPVL